MSDPLVDDLRARFGDAAVSTDSADRSAYAHDLWPRQLLSTRGNLDRPPGPRAIVWPADRDDLSALVGYARTHGVGLIPFGAGSGVVGGITGTRDTVAVDLKRMRTLHSVDLEAGVCVADAGILGTHLEDQLKRRGATLGHFPSSIHCSTLGGWVVTRGAGQCSGRYGKIEDMTLAMDGVFGNGEPFTLDAPRPGEADLRELMVGSEGLFGFVTRATMRVWPAPTDWRGRGFTFATMHDAWEAIRAIFQAGLRPAVARLYDPIDTYVFLQGEQTATPSVPKTPERPSPAAEWLLRRVMDVPRAVNAIADLASTRLYTRSLLIVIFEGDGDDPQAEALARATALCRRGGARDEGDGPAKRWLARRHAVSYRQPPTYARGLWVDTMEVAAPWSRLEALYDGVHAALSHGGLVMAHMSHAYPDGCSIYFTFAGASPDDATARETYDATWVRALRAAHEAGGTIAHHHGVGRSKRGAMAMEWGAGLRWIDALRRAADPGDALAGGPLLGDDPATGVAAPAEVTAVRVDAASRLVEAPATATVGEVRALAAAHGLTMAGKSDDPLTKWTRDALAASLASPRDPVDHVVAGWRATLPDGGRAWWLAAPRRSTGPDPLPLVLHDARFGEVTALSLRLTGGDEVGPARRPPGAAAASTDDAAVRGWVDRAAALLARP
jgi:alkyldihydroxyacetonephosphate synthase